MHIHLFPLRVFIIFLLSLILIVKALPAGQFTRTDDEPISLFSDEEQTPEGFDSSLLDSHVSNSAFNLHNSQDVPDLLALASASASTSTDATESLFSDSDQPGTDIGPSGNKDFFGDLGLAPDPEDFSVPDDTLSLNDAGSDQINQAASPDLFSWENSGESSSASPAVSSDLLSPEDNALSDDVKTSDSVKPGEGTVLGDDTLPNLVDPAEVSSAPEDDFLFDHGDPVEDTSSSVLDNTEGTLVASSTPMQLDGSTVPPKCPGRKTPACCLSAKAQTGFTLPGYKGGCVSRTYPLVSLIAGI